MNLQLIAVILLVVLYPVGFRIAKTEEPSRNVVLAGVLVLVLFIASGIYLVISSWVLFLMMLGSGVLLMAGVAIISNVKEMSQRARDYPETYGYLRGRVKETVFISMILFGGGIYLFALSIGRCLE